LDIGEANSLNVYFNINFKHFVFLEIEIEIEIFISEKNTPVKTIVRFQTLSQEEATLSLTYSVHS
jgi:hypothetical protein